MRVADVVAGVLEAAGIEHVFGLTGSVILDLMDGLYATEGRVRFVSVRHEQVAGHMAETYARLTHRPGVCLVHCGPGAANMVSAIAAAWRDCAPIVLITGNEESYRLGREVWHEWDLLNVFRPITKWTWQVNKPADIGYALRNAFARALSGRPGPVHLDIPKDIAAAQVPPEHQAEMAALIRFFKGRAWTTPFYRPEADAASVDQAAEILGTARRPLIVAGGGALWSGAAPQLRALVDRVKLPVITTDTARGVIDESNPLSLGVVGRFGNRFANRALHAADALLVLGCKLSDRATIDWSLVAPGAKIIHVDLDTDAITRYFGPTLGLQADAQAFLQALDRRLGGTAPAGWLAEVAGMREDWQAQWQSFLAIDSPSTVKPQRLMQEIRSRAPEDTIFTIGGGLHAEFASKLCVREPGTYIKSVGFGPLGFGFSAALAAKLVQPARPVVALVGDGEFMSVVQDVETAVREDLPVVSVIFNNNSYAAQKLVQQTKLGGRYIGSDVSNPDFTLLARAFGASGARVDDPSELPSVLDQALASSKPFLLDVAIDPTETDTLTFFQKPVAAMATG